MRCLSLLNANGSLLVLLNKCRANKTNCCGACLMWSRLRFRFSPTTRFLLGLAGILALLLIIAALWAAFAADLSLGHGAHPAHLALRKRANLGD